MPLSDPERKALTKAIEKCRKLLEEETHDQLEVIYRFGRDAPRGRRTASATLWSEAWPRSCASGSGT
jgi:hypothetical protein